MFFAPSLKRGANSQEFILRQELQDVIRITALNRLLGRLRQGNKPRRGTMVEHPSFVFVRDLCGDRRYTSAEPKTTLGILS